MKKLSIIILNYNTEKLLRKCLVSLDKVLDKTPVEIIVVDNGSIDGSLIMLAKDFPKVIVIKNDANLGYAKGNNTARGIAKGTYILFLNSDTEVPTGTIDACIEYLERNEDLGALTCKLLMPTGELDKDARRSFPTPWVAFTHFTLLDRVFTNSKLFARYWYGYISPDILHEVDVIQGAFFLTKKEILDQVGWFSEEYFLDGEDIDLCWKIKQKGYKIVYYPNVSILHIKKGTKKKSKSKSVSQGLKSMEMFYKKHLWSRYPLAMNVLVVLGIRILTLLRLIKLRLLK